jgi:hypothetical protein
MNSDHGTLRFTQHETNETIQALDKLKEKNA